MTRNFVRDTFASVFVASAFATANFGLAETYSVRDLGKLIDLPGRTESGPSAINNHGTVTEANVTNGVYQALLYGGSWTNLGTLGGAESYAAGINDSNLVVGRSLTIDGLSHAFLWTRGGTSGVPANPQMKDLGTLGGDESAAYDINNTGWITGYAQTHNREHAFSYSGGVMTDIGALLIGLPNSFGFSINDAGHVVGAAYDGNYLASHAFFYNGDTAVGIGDLGGTSSSALALNNNDQIAGYSTTTNGFDHAFRYFAGTMTDLGTLGGDYSYGNGINNSNVIVGGSFIDASNSNYRAFIAVSNSMVDLNRQLDATGAGWIMLEARAINDSGQIVGIGTYEGENHVFLLSPAPKITGIRTSGPDVFISFTTINSARYAVMSRPDVAQGSWIDVITGITGNGSILTATNAGGARLPKRFYRIRLALP